MNRHPYEQDQRRADMDGGWSFDELCIVGAVLVFCAFIGVIMTMPLLVQW